MDDTMNKFLRNAKNLGLCAEYTDKWTSAKSKKQLMDICLDANGISYVANAVAQGWGLSPEYICREFAPFNNGKFIRDKDGYTSAMYCSCGKGGDLAEIYVTTTALLAIDFIGTIVIPKNRICEMHLVNCKCYIKGEGKGDVYAYGDVEIYNENEAPIKVIRK